MAPITLMFHDEIGAFHPFSRLPSEVRQQVWEEFLLSTPGVHFVKLQTALGTWRWTKDDSILTLQRAPKGREVAFALHVDARPRKSFDTYFEPVAPCATADVSHYNTLHKQMKTLSRTCASAHAAVRRLSGWKHTIRLHDDRILALGQSQDLVYLEYFPPEQYAGAGHLETLPLCPGLGHIQRLAIRFSRGWSMSESKHRARLPSHLFEFLARHVPRLREFFFIDYLIVHKSQCRNKTGEGRAEAVRARTGPPRFRAGNRSYYEANARDWVVDSELTDILAWLRRSFVQYAKESRLSEHKNPDKVQFGMLACEWEIMPPQPPPPPPRSTKTAEQVKRRHAIPIRAARPLRIATHSTQTLLVPDTYEFTFTCDGRTFANRT